LGVRRWLNRRLGKKPQTFHAPYPNWLNQAFAARLDLPSRYRQLNSEPAPLHPVRPQAYKLTTGSFWPYRFETCDAGVMGVDCEVRHPFFDLRLLEYLFAIPPIPWFVQKDILRIAMRSILPEQVRHRPKAPLAGDPFFERLRHSEKRWGVDHFDPSPQLYEYVNKDKLPRGPGDDSYQAWVNMRPLSLNYWLRDSKTIDYKQDRKELLYELT
jgi:asparagine synthase (glutamine-hydrolysing)